MASSQRLYPTNDTVDKDHQYDRPLSAFAASSSTVEPLELYSTSAPRDQPSIRDHVPSRASPAAGSEGASLESPVTFLHPDTDDSSYSDSDAEEDLRRPSIDSTHRGRSQSRLSSDARSDHGHNDLQYRVSSSQLSSLPPPSRPLRKSLLGSPTDQERGRESRIEVSDGDDIRHHLTTSWAPLKIPSFSAFRSRTSHIPAWPHLKSNTALHPRRPASVAVAGITPIRLEPDVRRPISIDNPLPRHPCAPLIGVLYSPEEESNISVAEFPKPPSRQQHRASDSIDSRLTGIDPESSSAGGPSRQTTILSETGIAAPTRNSHVSMHSTSSMDSFSAYSPENDRSEHGSKEMKTPDLQLHYDGVQRPLSNGSQSSSTSSNGQKSAAPVSKLGAFFGWRSAPRSGTESPTTTFSDRSPSSPLPSPRLEKPLPKSPSGSRLTPPVLDIARANVASSLESPGTPLLLGNQQSNAHVKELEKEISHISSELASSIRREMELEDELERLRMELPNPPLSEQNRRGSDYFSDSGASSTRYPISSIDERIEHLESKMRKTEQEKAQLQNETTARIQAELTRRKELEEMIQQLEDQLDQRPAAQEASSDDDAHAGSRIQELELTLDETKRRLNKERNEKDSFEELYSATKLELAKYRNERDNLRDEVVPALKARVEGLEAQSAETEALVYENTRMQQELAALRGETPRTVSSRFAISEEGGLRGLSRSDSLAKRGASSLNRSGSVKGDGRNRSGSTGTPLTADGVKEIEDQRDALHKALKLLISRYDKQQKEHKRAITRMTSARDAADQLLSPRRSAYHKEVAFLKEEVTTLRKRTEDALEQKWQYEKGLGGLKMDLDRAEQETRSLRSLLHAHDIIPRSRSTAGVDDDEADSTDMELSISNLEKERDSMRRMAQDYRQQASSAGASGPAITQAAARIEELANQLDGEVRSNKDLRERLAQAVAKGEREQKSSTLQIEEMQKRLAGLEDSVLAAQQHSEHTLNTHESESRRMEEATSPALQRLAVSIPEPGKLAPLSPLKSPLRSPKTPRSRKLSEVSLLDAGRTVMLERKVRELENSLREAEEDMQTVVQRVNRSQLEVADLQTERDAALTQMRKLQKAIVAERESAEALLRA